MKGFQSICAAALFLVFVSVTNFTRAQEAIGLGTDAPNADAILDIVSADRGVLIPRMTTVQRDANLGALAAGDEGMLIYNTTDSEFNCWDGTQWVVFPAAPTGDYDWHIGLGAVPPTNITDNIWTDGNVGLGMNNPIYRLDVAGDIRLDDGAGGHDIIGGATGSIFLRSNAGVVIDLEEDGGTTQYFRVRNAVDEILFRVDHNGTTTVDGDLYLENTPGVTSGGDLISFEGGDPVDIVLATGNTSASLDIESQGTIDMVLDRDNNNAASEFRIKRNADGTAAVNTLFIVPEDDAPYVYPYGTNSGETGGIKLRELAVGGGNFVRLRAPDAIGANFALTLPDNDGAANDVLQTDGTGILSWVDPATFAAADNDWTRNAGDMYPTNLTDDVGIGTNTPGARLHVDGGTIPFLLDVSSTNVLRWNNRRLEWLNSGFSVFIGQNAGQNDDLSNNTNVFIGDFSGDANTTGAANVAIGYNTFSTNTTASANVAVGTNALSVSTGSGNTALGGSAMVSNTTGAQNVGVGRAALQNNTNGANNVAIGSSVMTSNVSGSDNVAIGYFAMISNTASENIAVGIRSLGSNTSGTRLTAVGVEALNGNTTASDNLAIGYYALRQNSTGQNHIAIGNFALDANTTGQNNIAIGNDALSANVSGNGSIAIGLGALENSNTGGGVTNIAIGSLSMTNTTTGVANVAIGGNSLTTNTTGNNNVSIGTNSMLTNSLGFSNVALGASAMQANTTGNYNVALGYQTLDANTTSNYNTALGTQALSANTIGFTNTAVGAQALMSNTIADGNVAMGYLALNQNTTAEYNVALGYLALNGQSYANGGATWTPGNVAIGYASQAATNSTGGFTGTRNTSVGHETLNANTIGQENTAIGFRSQYVATTGGRNTSVGYAAAADLTVGSYNTAVGSDAMNNNTSGENNTAVGYQALFTQAFANGGTAWDMDNTAVGYQALYSTNSTNSSNGFRNTALGSGASYSNIRGANNVAVGYGALNANQNANDNVAVGFQAGGNATVAGSIYIGYQAGQNNATANTLYIQNSNSTQPLVYGDFTTREVGINWPVASALPQTLAVNGDASKTVAGNWLANSDSRLKKNIQYMDSHEILQRVLSMKGVTYEWADEMTGLTRPEGVQYGFIAQDLKKVWPTKVAEDNQGYLMTAYGDYDAMFVEAFKAQQQQIEEQQSVIEKQQQAIDAILERLEVLEGEKVVRR